MIKELTVDSMPREVAVEMLTSNVRLSTQERKNCQRALEKHFVSTLEPKSKADCMTRRLKGSTIFQLAKWNKRATNRRASAQSAYLRFKKLEESIAAEPDGESIIAKEAKNVRLLLVRNTLKALNDHASQLDTFKDLLDTEINSRHATLKN